MPKDILDASFTLSGFNRVGNQLRAAASTHPDLTDPIIEAHTKSEAARLRRKAYPPELPNQKYKRTYDLQRHFRAQRRGPGRWAVINRVRSRITGMMYAYRVIKKGFQGHDYFLGRWWIFEDVLQKNAPMLTRDLSVAIEKLLDRQRDT